MLKPMREELEELFKLLTEYVVRHDYPLNKHCNIVYIISDSRASSLELVLCVFRKIVIVGT